MRPERGHRSPGKRAEICRMVIPGEGKAGMWLRPQDELHPLGPGDFAHARICLLEDPRESKVSSASRRRF